MDSCRFEFVGGARVSGRLAVTGLNPVTQRKELFSALPLPVLDQSATTPFDCAVLAVKQVTALAAAGTTDLTLNDGSLLDLFGFPATFTLLKAVYVQLLDPGSGTGVASGTQLTVGNAPSNAHPLFFGAATHTAKVSYGGPPLLLGDPVGVTVDGTHKVVRITNTGSVAATFLVALGGN